MNAPAFTNPCTPRSYHRRNVRWYHSHIIDWMLANPSGKLDDCAKLVGKTPATLSAIIRSDLFQAALAKRKADFAARQDLILGHKLTEVAVRGLDTILAVLEKKKDGTDLDFLAEVTNNSLQRLGYGLEGKASAPSVQVNVNQQNNVVPVGLEELNEARLLMRQNQQRLGEARPPVSQAIPASEGSASSAYTLDALLIEAEILPEEASAKGATPVNAPKEE